LQVKSKKKGGLVGHHAQYTIPTKSFPLSGFDTSGSDSSGNAISFAGWVMPIDELFLDFDRVVEHHSLEVFPSLMNGWPIFN